MTRNKIALFAVPVLAAILIGAGFANPAFAKNEKIEDTNTTTPFGPFTVGGICGVGPTELSGVNHMVVKEWKNGKLLIHIDISTVWTDPNNGDAVVAEASFVENQKINPNTLPVTLQINEVRECADGSTQFNFHCGFTFDENGEFHIHQADCGD